MRLKLQDEAKEARERVALLVEQLQGLHDRIEALYQALRDAITRFVSTQILLLFFLKHFFTVFRCTVTVHSLSRLHCIGPKRQFH